MGAKYGCIGEVLKHSFSKEIHNALADYQYDIIEIPRDALENFLHRADFDAINVTIPYKELVMPYMYSIDEHALAIGSVNTVVKRNGKLYGYNTDFYGMSMLLKHASITLAEKKTVILGTGGTSKTALAVARAEGASEILRVSRDGKDGAITYEELYEKHADAEIIINTTPCGMYPKIFNAPIDISKFPRLSGVVDAVYNPLRTPLVSAAMERGIPAVGGLYMLVAQAVRASEIFIDTKYPESDLLRVYKRIAAEKENIVLIGMPASGKSTVGALLSSLYSRELIDTDELIVKKAGKSIPEIFAEDGEAVFRSLESEVINEVASKTAVIIATGGGAVLKRENVAALRENGKIYFIDRPLDALIPTDDRPLANDTEAIKKRYDERYDIYCKAADVKISAECSADAVAEKIREDFDK